MTRRQPTALICWAAAWALALVTVVSPGLAQRWWGWALILATAGMALAFEHLVGRSRSHGVLPPDADLPGPERVLALVCGEHLERLFGQAGTEGAALRHGQEGSYLAVGRSERLSEVVTALLERQPWRARQLRVLWAGNPSQMLETGQAAAQLHTLRRQMARLQRQGLALPLLIASYLPAGIDGLPWFIWQQGQSTHEPECAEKNPANLRAALHAQMAARWWADEVIPALYTQPSRHRACQPAACAVLSVPVSSAEPQHSLWAGWMAQQAGVLAAVAEQAGPSLLPLPEPLLALDLGTRPWAATGRTWGVAIWLACVATVAAITGVAWHNHALSRQVSHNLHQYRTQPAQVAARRLLETDDTQLARYQRDGVPLSLGLGLYRGAWLQARIAPWLVPSAPPPEQLQSLHLPSQALFSTGSAVLSDEASPALFQALLALREHRREGGLIVVSGHSDDRGQASANQHLSRARAAAVRDWLQRTGGLPAHCFAVQGLGASQPLASNEDEQGRAANRRVDIRLVPEAGACASADGAPGIHGARP
ncbi:OmpA family protein [Pseudomonas sp. KNUC1026]|uniref:OmpA family protein n=1 Tax=Pseudomonas sp. KNUC1026 TaxID=2893890 RepID=UPI001F37D0D1|nr:OmpA family protein [Pseudomonas sp. KNUC1026]UFH51057.1 OmpA family protein [Pseudomonas sp. KNUC1026]